MDQPMQEQPMQEEAAEPAGTSIELIIADDGSMTINVEAGDGAAEPMPVADINEALAKIKQIAGAMLAETMQNAPAQQQEDAAYQQEMMA